MKKFLLLFVLLIFQVSTAQNNAITFNGVDQQINTSTQQSNINFSTQNFTIEAWVKPAAFVSGTGVFEHTILGNDNWNATNNFGYVLRTGGSRKLDFTFGQGNAWYSVTSANAVFTVDQWTHVAIVRSGTTFTLYANGVQVAQQTFTQNMAGSTANLCIGENGNGNGRRFNGALDEIKFWDIARTLSDVRGDLAEATTPLNANLVVYFKMNQTTGTAVTSETPINLSAQYQGGANVNTTAGFFRTYNYENFNAVKNWTNTLNWVNGFIPNNPGAGDIINLNTNCTFNQSSYNLLAGCTLNITNGTLFQMDPAQGITFNNYGTLNIFDTFQFNPTSPSSSKFENYGIINIAGSSNFYQQVFFKSYSGSVVNNYGYFGKLSGGSDSNAQILNGATFNNFNTATFSPTNATNRGAFNNYNIFSVNSLSNGFFGENLPIFSNYQGSISVSFSFDNYAIMNNYATINLSGGSLADHFNYSGAIINNIDANSTFRIQNTGCIFENRAEFNYQNAVENGSKFLNTSTGILKAQIGGNSGSVRQFENLAGATFTNQGTYIAGGDFNNGGSHANTGTRSGGGNFSGSLYANPLNANLSPSTNSGTGIGTLNFFTGLTNNGNVNIEIGGITAGSGHDSINIPGTATISGTLNASIINGYIPPVGTTDFTIISATTLTGTFGTVVLPVATQGVTWSIVYSSTAVRLRAVVNALTNTTILTRCDTYTWPLNNQTYTTSGNYFFLIPNSNITQRLTLTILPASEIITTQTSCGEFYWANNFTVYNQSGTYTGTTLNCVTQKLVLTIIPTSQNVTTQTACNTFTWANNGQTYSQSGNYTGTTTNCITEKLNLTIIPASDNVVFNSACSSYTWSNSGQTYTQSGIYTGTTTNCITQKLNLTIYPSTTETVTATNCGGYFWSFADEYYTASGSYIYTDGCDTKTLNLTITPLFEVFTTVTACGNYTWVHNGETYTTSGIYDGYIDECNIQKLNLTINSTTWNGLTWSNLPPDNNKRATFTGNYSASSDLTACSVIVSGTAVVTVPSGFDFTVTNEITVVSTANLVFENTANLLQTNNVSNTGNITQKRSTSVQRLAYTYWSSPVANQNALAFSPLTLSNRFYTYNEANNTFVTVASPNITDLIPAVGYGIRAPNTFAASTTTVFEGTFVGTPNNGNYSFDATKTLDGYNLIGNPYPSTILASSFFTANPNVSALYFWDNRDLGTLGNRYAVKNTTGAIASALTPARLPTDFIAVGQGFFVAASQTTTVNFTNAMRSSENNPAFFRTANNNKSLFKLNLLNPNQVFNQIAIGYLANATNGVDNQMDAVPFGESPTMVSSLINNVDYVIQGRSLPFVNSDIVKLGFKTDVAGDYSFTTEAFEGVFANNQNIFIKDNLVGITHNINQSPYNFTSNVGTFNNRFEVVYQAVLGINNPNFNDNSVFVFEKDGAIHINSGAAAMKNVTIFDLRGIKITEKTNINANKTQLELNVEQQVLLVKITSEDGGVVTKKIVY